MSNTQTLKKPKKKNPLLESKKKKDKKSPAYHFDLRQDLAWENYIDPRSSTWNNAKKSAIKAGYSEKTASCITVERWWIERVENLAKMLPLAEKNLMEDMTMDTETFIVMDSKPKKRKKKKGDDDDDDFDEEESNETPQIIKMINPKLRKIRQDASIFIAETVGRKRYHKKFEIEGNSKINLVEGNEQIDKLFAKRKK